MTAESKPVKLSEMLPPVYRKFYNWKGKYIACKGSRGSGKSYAASVKLLMYMMEHPLANALCIRQVKDTLRDSCWATLKQVASMLGVYKYWKFTKSPLEVEYLPTHQKILFRGMDDPLKITSINVETGFITHVLVEEAFQIPDEAAFEVVEFSIRGEFPQEGEPGYDPGLYRQFIFIFNPYSPSTWLKARFFDEPDPTVLAMTTTYKDNINPVTGKSNLGKDVIEKYEKLYITNPKRARVICDGDWGVSEGLVYDGCWDIVDFDPIEVLNDNPDVQPIFGLDFGFVVSYTAFAAMLIDVQNRELYVFDEIYERGMTNLDIAKRICEKGYGKEVIVADSADPQNIFTLANGIDEGYTLPDGSQRYVTWSLPNVQGIHKTSVEFGINLMQEYHMNIHPRCKNFIVELENYAWAVDKDGKYTGKPIKEYDHLLDASRYPVTTATLTGLGHGAVYEVKGGVRSDGSPTVPSAIPSPDGLKETNPVITAEREVPTTPLLPESEEGSWVFGPSTKARNQSSLRGRMNGLNIF